VDAGLGLCVLVITVVLKCEAPTLCFLIDVVLDVRLELHVWDAGFKLWRELQALCLSTEVVLRRGLWALRLGIAVVLRRRLWACVVPLHEWLWLALRLKHGLCYLMTYLQWFLNSLQNPLQKFWNSAVDWDRFQNTLDFSFGNKIWRLDWQSFEIPWAGSCLDFDLRQCTVKLFEATRYDCRECLDTQSRPHRYSELVVSVLLNWERLPTAFTSVLLTDHRSRDWTHIL